MQAILQAVNFRGEMYVSPNQVLTLGLQRVGVPHKGVSWIH